MSYSEVVQATGNKHNGIPGLLTLQAEFVFHYPDSFHARHHVLYFYPDAGQQPVVKLIWSCYL
jgi:hypothetical protein